MSKIIGGEVIVIYQLLFLFLCILFGDLDYIYDFVYV